MPAEGRLRRRRLHFAAVKRDGIDGGLKFSPGLAAYHQKPNYICVMIIKKLIVLQLSLFWFAYSVRPYVRTLAILQTFSGLLCPNLAGRANPHDLLPELESGLTGPGAGPPFCPGTGNPVSPLAKPVLVTLVGTIGIAIALLAGRVAVGRRIPLFNRRGTWQITHGAELAGDDVFRVAETH